MLSYGANFVTRWDALELKRISSAISPLKYRRRLINSVLHLSRSGMDLLRMGMTGRTFPSMMQWPRANFEGRTSLC